MPAVAAYDAGAVVDHAGDGDTTIADRHDWLPGSSDACQSIGPTLDGPSGDLKETYEAVSVG